MLKQITDEIECDFRRFLPAFEDTNKWTSSVVRQAMIEADCATGASTWGKFDITDDHNFKKRGMYYYTAHLLSSLYGKDGDNGNIADISPEARLNVVSKSVGDESVGYRMTALESTADDFLSTTLYGVMFVTLRRKASPLPFCV